MIKGRLPVRKYFVSLARRSASGRQKSARKSEIGLFCEICDLGWRERVKHHTFPLAIRSISKGEMVKDAFDLLAEYVREACGTNHVCYHLDDVQECEVKSHPTYEQLRRRAVDARVKRKTSQLWESLIAMGRMADLRGDDKWRMIIVDCLVPFLRGHSWNIQRKFYCDLGDVRSDMLEAALTVWRETVSGVPPRDVPGLMVKTAVNEAYRRADEHKHESASRDAEILASL